MKTIEVIVAPSGATSVETKGFTGAGCQQASLFLQAALGQLASEKLTDEYYSAAQSQLSSQQAG